MTKLVALRLIEHLRWALLLSTAHIDVYFLDCADDDSHAMMAVIGANEWMSRSSFELMIYKRAMALSDHDFYRSLLHEFAHILTMPDFKTIPPAMEAHLRPTERDALDNSLKHASEVVAETLAAVFAALHPLPRELLTEKQPRLKVRTTTGRRRRDR